MIPIIDGYTDKTNNSEIFVGRSSSEDWHDKFVCFDVRNVYKAGFDQKRAALAYDLKMLYDHDGDLSRLAKKECVSSASELLDIEARFSAHVRAITEARMETNLNKLSDLVPRDVLSKYMMTRVKVMGELFDKLDESSLFDYKEKVWKVFKDILIVEAAKIKIDTQYIDKMLLRNDLAVHETKFFRHMLGTSSDGFAKTRISPVGSRTWRFRVEGGLNCMAIPHGVCRKGIVSRFDGGKIFTLDFNAIDYRCLVKATDDVILSKFYLNERDFHSKTASVFGEVVTPELRSNTKKMTYTHIYGGSIETLQKQTLMRKDQLTQMIAKLDKLFAPISAFRKRLSDEARKSGYVMTPGAQRVKVFPDDHDGKIVGLYAQSYSSAMFNLALHEVNEILSKWKSRVIFTVHDEIAVDVHPDERDVIETCREIMENVTGFVVKMKEGANYGEATD